MVTLFIVLGILAALILFIALLPVTIIIKNEEKRPLILQYRVLFMTFGGKPNPDNSFEKLLEKALGTRKIKKVQTEKPATKEGQPKTVSEKYDLIVDAIKEVSALLKKCELTRVHIKIRCVGDGPDEAAIHYGEVCAATSSLLGLLSRYVTIRDKNCNIDIGCDFFGSKGLFRYDLWLTFRVGRAVASLWKILMGEAKRSIARKLKGAKKQA